MLVPWMGVQWLPFEVQKGNSEQTEITMLTNEPKTCAHIPCRCVVPAGRQYCGQWCEEAGSEDVEIACECDHPPVCSLTAAQETVA